MLEDLNWGPGETRPINLNDIQGYIKDCQDEYDRIRKPWSNTQTLVEGKDYEIISSTIKK